jgi:hypothetical protein
MTLLCLREALSPPPLRPQWRHRDGASSTALLGTCDAVRKTRGCAMLS